MKRDKLDVLFSKIVRFRTGEPPVCQSCGLQSPEGHGLDCAHIHSRRYTSGGLRWSVDNALCLCRSCHRMYTAQPANWGRFLMDLLGEGHLDLLNEKLNNGQRVKKADKEAIYQHLKGQWEHLRDRRMDGDIGYIEITDYF